jgi:hypothetical protein
MVERVVKSVPRVVAIGVAKISEISAIWALARRVLDRRAAVDGLGDHETAAIVRVSHAASSVLNTGLSAHCGKEGIVEFR